MTNVTMKLEQSQPQTDAAVHLFDNWFDPIEAGLRDRVREFIHGVVEGELDMALSRPRYARCAKASSGEAEGAGGASDHRHGHRSRSLLGSFGQVEIEVPRARLNTPDGKTISSAHPICFTSADGGHAGSLYWAAGRMISGRTTVKFEHIVQPADQGMRHSHHVYLETVDCATSNPPTSRASGRSQRVAGFQRNGWPDCVVLLTLRALYRSAPLMAFVMRQLGASVGDNLQCAHDAHLPSILRRGPAGW